MAEAKKKIVCVEDEPDMIQLVKFLLGGKGYEVIGAVGGIEGLDVIRRTQPDLVLLDLMMPDMSGAEVYQHMKAEEHLKRIPVIVITAQAQSVERILWQQVIKTEEYIVKPFDTRQLLRCIERTLQSAAVKAG